MERTKKKNAQNTSISFIYILRRGKLRVTQSVSDGDEDERRYSVEDVGTRILHTYTEFA
jgi:hypothetical protein